MIDLKKEFYNVKDISELLRCSRSKVYMLKYNGTIQMHKNVAGVWVARRTEIEKLLENEVYAY